ncbi:MAG: hypothetical protein GF353_12150 [Candidatus Lokiarchaeota archaeon]|nr:hypothetical protein [Candidatus Lokiarchaeota archaeon]
MILKSPQMKYLTNLIPKWFKIVQLGLEVDKEETYRTIRHIFRSLWIYFSILNDTFPNDITTKNLNVLKEKLVNLRNFSNNLFPLLLLYHDLGRPFNRIWHSLESYDIVNKEGLFDEFNIGQDQLMVLLGVIKHHLLLGTIFTGEASYYGSIALFKDRELRNLFSSPELIETYFNAQLAFTLIDIWGYDYSRIYDHYFKYYNTISKNLINLFTESVSYNNQGKLNLLSEELILRDNKNLKWRISCALRIFQFVDTDRALTENFYYSKVIEALSDFGYTWKQFNEILGMNHSLIQLKYALSILMVLASGKFKSKPIDKGELIDPSLFKFWIHCTKKIQSYEDEIKQKKRDSPLLWNYIFEIPRRWYLKGEFNRYVHSDEFFENIYKSKPYFNFNQDMYIIKIQFPKF